MSTTTFDTAALENEAVRELTADEMASIHGRATFPDYGLLQALIIPVCIGKSI